MAGISNHYDAMVSIQSIITSLALSGMAGDPIIQEVLNYNNRPSAQSSEGFTLPRVLIAPWGSETIEDGNNAQDETGYGIVVAIVCDASNGATSLEQRLAWRQAIRRRMKNRSLNGQGGSINVTGSKNLNVEPLPVVLPSAYLQDQKFVSLMVVRCVFQEPRT
jgi:hypothetical protein